MHTPDAAAGRENFETSTVRWWLQNDKDIASRCRTLAREATHLVEHAARVVSGIADDDDAVRSFLADTLRDLVRELNPVADQTSLFTDLMEAVLEEVDWHALADEFLLAVKTTPPAQTMLNIYDEPDNTPQ